MEFFETVYRCKSVHSYLNKNVPDNVIDQIVLAGNMAPTTTPNLHILVVTNKILLDKFDEFGKAAMLDSDVSGFVEMASKPNFRILEGAPVLVMIFVPRVESKTMEVVNVAHAHCAVQNMMLAATALGLGSYCHSAPAFALRNHPEWKSALGMDEADEVLATFILDHATAPSKPVPRRIATNVRYCK